MGILRADLLTHSQLSNEGGSIVLDGSGDYLSFAAHSSFAPATADVTFELWFYLNADSDFNVDSADSNYYFFDLGSNGYRIQMYSGLLRFGIDGSTWTPPASGVSKTKWHHVAGVREGNSLDLYLDGKHVGQKSTTASVTSTSLTIGQYGGNLSYNGVPHGYISNFRYVRGVVYRGEFTPPKFELKNIPGTIVLGCQSTSSATDFAVTPSTISVGGNTAASSFHPGLKKDITDTGVVFDGFGSFATSTFMVPPKGKTTERNRGRGFYGVGLANPSQSDNIDFLNIQSLGNTTTFGNLTTAKYALGSGASSTRGIFCGGYDPTSSPDTDINTIEYITIATEGNAIDFGDRTVVGRNTAAASSSTRVVMAAGQVGNPGIINTIDFITTATTANATDFGDLLSITNSMCNANNSPTRGIFSGGNAPSSPYNQNVIQFVTMASAGNATDFGDLTVNARDAAGGTASSNTRGLILIGNSSPNNNLNTVDFITMASTGNAADFGDIFTGRYSVSSCSNSNRAVFLGGRTTSASVVYYNAMEFVTISTTGNTSDFGDITGATGGTNAGAANSDSHGGL